jgi:hypothetical protein
MGRGIKSVIEADKGKEKERIEKWGGGGHDHEERGGGRNGEKRGARGQEKDKSLRARISFFLKLLLSPFLKA